MLSPTEKCPFRFLNEIFDPFYGLVVRIPKLGLTASDSGHEVARKRSIRLFEDTPLAKTGAPEIS
jgi:hypothetical protein